jgi:copper chaperone CopZ
MQKLIAVVVLTTLLSKQGNTQFTKATLQATGLTCAMCNNAINKALQKIDFVDSVKSDIKNSAFNITFKQNTIVDIDALKKAVDDAGFSVGSLKITGNFNSIKVENDKHVQLGTSSFHFLNITDQVLEGEKTITIVDKDFVTAKQFKKIVSSSKMSCVQTGKATSGCCTKDGIKEGTRIYHATI